MYAVRRGLGATYQDALDCSNAPGTAWGALVAAFNPKCFSYSPAAWAEMAQFVPPLAPVAPPAVSAGTSLTPAPYTEAEYQVALDASIAAGSAATKEQTLAAFQSQGTVCASGETLAADGVTCVAPTASWWLYGALALVAVFAVVSLGGGSARRYGR
jgi:hypothetical protein